MHWGSLYGRIVRAGKVSVKTNLAGVSRQYEKFLFRQSRNFRFDEAWRNEERSCGCRQRIGIG